MPKICWPWNKKFKNKNGETSNSQDNCSRKQIDVDNDRNIENYVASIPKDDIRETSSNLVSPGRRSVNLHCISDNGESSNQNQGKRVLLVNNAQELQLSREESSKSPCEIPNNHAPRKSSKFHNFKLEDLMTEDNEPQNCAAEKPMEDYNYLPSTSDVQYFSKHDRNYHSIDRENASNINQDGDEIIRVLRPTILENPTVPTNEMEQKYLRESSNNTRGFNSNTLTQPTGKYVRHMPFRANKQSTILQTEDGRLFMPVELDKMRSSFFQQENPQLYLIQPLNNKDVKKWQLPRLSVRRLSEGFTSNSLPTNLSRYSVASKKRQEYQPVDNQTLEHTTPEVYSRGRASSVLQYSVKALTSKNDSPTIRKKNIRISTPNDVFSVENKSRSVKKCSPKYVFMENGQSMLISEYLNPITSILGPDLKNGIPKDPLTKPKEAYKLVPLKKPFTKQPGKNKTTKQLISYPTESTTSDSYESDDSFDDNNDSSSFTQRNQHSLNATEKPNVSFFTEGNHDSLLITTKFKKGTSVCEGDVIDQNTNKDGFPSEEDESKEELDFICYPTGKYPKKFPELAETDSKLRWRIIIKRSDKKNVL